MNQSQSKPVLFGVATREHITQLCHIVKRQWDWTDDDVVLNAICALVRQDDGAKAFVLLDGGNVVGTCFFDKGNGVTTRFKPWLMALWVAPDFRGRGYGQNLANYAMAYARKLGFKQIFLDTEKSAKVYHLKHGWRKCSWTVYNGNRVEIMVHSL